MPEIDLYIIGATTRATADMARRAGLNVGCFDSYADFDLRSHAAYVQLLELENNTPKLSPLDFKNIVDKTPWVYGGPLENSPDWLAQAQEGSNCWGNLAASNLSVRDIWTLSEQLRQTGFSIQCPQILKLHEIPQKPRKWLVKPFAGTGGWEIQPARKWLSSHRDPSSKHFQGYWQKRIQGPTFGASIISDGRSAIVAGICRSLHGTPGRPFAYRGSIGPIRSRWIQKLHPELTQLAQWLTSNYQIQGLWNIDLVYDRRTRKWFLLEVNPRPSASMEVLELAAGKSLISIHKQVFCGESGWLESAKKFAESYGSTKVTIHKEVIYCETSRKFRENDLPAIEPNLWNAQRWADIPCPDSQVYRGYPLMTKIRSVNSL